MICALSSALLIQAKDWTQYVNPLMGTLLFPALGE